MDAAAGDKSGGRTPAAVRELAAWAGERDADFEAAAALRDAFAPETNRALAIVRAFLRRSNRILYGGQAIDYALPPNPKAPVIEYNFASASLGFSKVGYNWAVEGTGFNKDPDLNLMIVVGDGWQTVVANTLDLCGLKDAKSLPAAIAAVKSCVEDATSAVDESLANGNALKSGLLSEQRLELGPFPKACSGSLPLAIGIIPVNLVVGRGPTFLSNCLL